MIAAILIAAWVLIGPALGILIGKSIAMADRQDEVRRQAARIEAQQRLIRVGGTWVA